jgi:hypothetical protein
MFSRIAQKYVLNRHMKEGAIHSSILSYLILPWGPMSITNMYKYLTPQDHRSPGICSAAPDLEQTQTPTPRLKLRPLRAHITRSYHIVWQLGNRHIQLWQWHLQIDYTPWHWNTDTISWSALYRLGARLFSFILCPCGSSCAHVVTLVENISYVGSLIVKPVCLWLNHWRE